MRIPHIGWAALQETAQVAWGGSPLERLESGAEEVYFVHSFHCVPKDPAHRIAFVDYGGQEITASVRKDNIVGVQFHPERSGIVGQRVLENFLQL